MADDAGEYLHIVVLRLCTAYSVVYPHHIPSIPSGKLT